MYTVFSGDPVFLYHDGSFNEKVLISKYED